MNEYAAIAFGIVALFVMYNIFDAVAWKIKNRKGRMKL